MGFAAGPLPETLEDGRLKVALGDPTITTAKQWTIGSVKTPSVAEIKSLSANPTAVNRYETFEITRGGQGAGGGTDYVVPAGKTLYITRVIYVAETAGSGLVIGYGDDAVADGTSAPTNPVGLVPPRGLQAATVSVQYAVDVFLAIPAGKYPYAWAVTGSIHIIAMGVEV